MLQSALYLSKAKQHFNDADIQQLVYQSRIRNKERNITGFLNFQRNYFVQYIEGKKEEIANLKKVLSNDERHEIVIWLEKPITNIQFNVWSMRRIENEVFRKLDMASFIMEELSKLRSVPTITEAMIDDMWENIAIVAKYYKFLHEQALSYHELVDQP